MNRVQALAVLREKVRLGYHKRDLFIAIVVDQDDWIGAMFKPDAVIDATRLDVAQTVLMLLSTHTGMETDELLRTLDSMAQRERSKTRHEVLIGLINDLRDGTAVSG